MLQSSSIPALHRWLSEPRENHACYQVAPSCYKLPPLTKVSKELRTWTVRSQEAGPRERRCHGRNDCSEPRLLYPRIHRKVINSLTWDILLLFSHSVVSDSLQHHGLQHARPPCPSPTPGAHSNSCPWSRWCHPTISPSVVPFSPCLQSFPASGSFPVNQLFTSGGQSTGASALASNLPVNIQGSFPLGWTGGWISLQSKGLSRVFSSTTVQKHRFFSPQSFLWATCFS